MVASLSAVNYSIIKPYQIVRGGSRKIEQRRLNMYKYILASTSNAQMTEKFSWG